MFLQSISGCVLIDLRIPLLGQPGVLLKYIYGYKLLYTYTISFNYIQERFSLSIRKAHLIDTYSEWYYIPISYQ